MTKRESKYMRRKRAKRYMNSLFKKHAQKWAEATENYIWGGHPTKIKEQ